MLIKKVQKNQPITADMINNIIDSIRECQIQSGVGYGFSRNAGGTTLTIKNQAITQQAQTNTWDICPFTPTISSSTSGTIITFSAGTINGILPTNMFSGFEVTSNTINYFYLACSSNGKVITSASIQKSTSPPAYYISTPDTAPSGFNKTIAVVTAEGIPVRTIQCADLVARVVASIQEDNVTYVAGDRNFIQYYNWV